VSCRPGKGPCAVVGPGPCKSSWLSCLRCKSPVKPGAGRLVDALRRPTGSTARFPAIGSAQRHGVAARRIEQRGTTLSASGCRRGSEHGVTRAGRDGGVLGVSLEAPTVRFPPADWRTKASSSSLPDVVDEPLRRWCQLSGCSHSVRRTYSDPNGGRRGRSHADRAAPPPARGPAIRVPLTSRIADRPPRRVWRSPRGDSPARHEKQSGVQTDQ